MPKPNFSEVFEKVKKIAPEWTSCHGSIEEWKTNKSASWVNCKETSLFLEGGKDTPEGRLTIMLTCKVDPHPELTGRIDYRAIIRAFITAPNQQQIWLSSLTYEDYYRDEEGLELFSYVEPMIIKVTKQQEEKKKREQQDEEKQQEDFERRILGKLL